MLRWLGPCVIILACLVCYGPALDGDVLWDDPAHLTEPALRTPAGLVRIWTEVTATQQYYPVLHTAFWLEHKIWGDAVRGYHLVNVMQHALACCLLALILQRLRTPRHEHSAELTANRDATARASGHPTPAGSFPRNDWFAWGGALVVAVHPVCVESVAWMTEQKNTLSTLFYFGAALAWLRFVEKRTPADYVAATLCFLLAVGSKTVTCTLPAALLVVQWWRHGRLDWRRDVAPLLPWFAVALAAGLGTAWIERNLIGAEGADYTLTFGQRLLLAGRIVWFYLGSVVWPAELAFFYEHWKVPTAAPGWWPFLVAALTTTIVFWFIRQRSRGPLAAWLLWVGTLFPALGFFNVFPFAFSYVADHFQYLATFGLIGAAAIGVASWCERSAHQFRRAIGVSGCVLCLVFAALSRAESRHYQSNLALFSASVAAVPDNWMAQRCLGWAWSKIEGRAAEAIRHYTESLRLNPESPDTCYDLASVLLRDPDRIAEATALLQRSIELRPHFAEPHVALARLLRDQPDRADEMLAHLRTALATKPRYAEAHRLFADALSHRSDRQADALAHYQEALRWDESLVAAHLGLGRLQSRLPGRQAEAAARFQQALTLDPQNAAAHFELANLLADRPETAAAAEPHYTALLRLEPSFPAAHFNYANLLARLPGRAPDALSHYEAALALEPNSADIHGNLGNTYNQLGRTADAIASYRRALALAPELPWVHQNLALALAPLPGQTAQALRHATEAVRLAPNNPTSHNTLAIVHAHQGSLTQARDAWQKVLELNPQFAPARENLARVNRLLNR
ncbi:MAG TPA: tetratricopeptide repeat protein [Lacunisphaera sp.]|nr:tetratricopeptide repeat protein [Lacunisphaera sp.]